MNTSRKLLVSSLAAALLAISASIPARGQTVVAERTTMHTGTVSEYEPVRQTLIIRGDRESAPVTYNVTQATTFVDESGTPVRADSITSGVPVVVHSIREGEHRIASRIVVKRPVEAPAPVQRRVTVVPDPAAAVQREVTVEKRVTVVPEPRAAVETSKTVTTTSTTGGGTITAYTPGMPTLVLRSEPAADPVSYSISRTTTFVDEDGAPVAVERIKPGVPVSVHYVRDGDRMVAERVIVVRQR
jgi:hypothetical protein